MSAALAAKAAPREATPPTSESFDSFLGRNVRRWPVMVGLALIFLIIRAFGARAGAVMLIAISAALVPVTVIRPEIGVYALILNFVNEWDTYYKLQSYLPFSLPVLFDTAVAIGIALRSRETIQRLELGSAQLVLLGFYVSLVTLGVLVSDVSVPHAWASFRTGFLIRPTVFLFVILLVRDPKSLHRLLLALLMAHLFLMATSLSDLIQKGASALYRIRGTVSAINYLSYVCVVTISLIISLYVYARDRLVRYALLALALLTLLVCMRTLSRSGFYAFAATLLFLGFRFLRNPRTLAVAFGFVILFYLMTPAALEQRLSEVSFEQSDRFLLSRVALRMALDNPALGVGFLAYDDRFLAYDYEHIFRRKKAPHSLYLGIAAASGLPALLAYLAMFGVTLAQLFQVERGYRRAGESRAMGLFLSIGLQAALVGHFVFGLAGSYGDSYYAFLVLALSFVLIRHYRERRAEFLP